MARDTNIQFGYTFKLKYDRRHCWRSFLHGATETKKEGLSGVHAVGHLPQNKAFWITVVIRRLGAALISLQICFNHSLVSLLPRV